MTGASSIRSMFGAHAPALANVTVLAPFCEVDGDAEGPVVVPAPGVLERHASGASPLPTVMSARAGHDVGVVGVAVVAPLVVGVVDDQQVARRAVGASTVNSAVLDAPLPSQPM